MTKSIKTLLTPPVFADTENTILAAIVHPVLILSVLCNLFLMGLIGISNGGVTPVVLVLGINTVLTIFMFYLLLQGYVRATAWLFILMIGASITAVNLLWADAYTPAPAGYVILILATGMMLGRRAGVYVTAACIVLLFLSVALKPDSPLTQARLTPVFVYSLFYILTASMLHMSIRMVDYRVQGIRQREQQISATLSQLKTTTVSKNYFDNVLRSMSNLLMVLEVDGQIQTVNPATLKLLGYAEEDLIGQPITKILTSGNLNLSGSIEGETIRGNEAVLLTRDNQRIPIAYSQSAMRDQHGSLEGIVLVAEDITERRAAEADRLRNAMRYRALFEQSNDAIFLLSLEGKHLAVNQRAADMLGYKTSELITMGFRDVVVAAELNKSEQVLKNLLSGNKIPLLERTLRHKDGSEIPVEINVELVHDADGKPMHIQSVIRDITHRKQIERQISYQAGLLQNVNDAIISTDMHNIIQSWNKAAEHMYGWKADEVIGQKLAEIVPTQFESDSEDFIKQQYIVRGYWRSEVKQRARDGRPLMILSSVSILRDNHGELIGTVAVNHDITARKKAEMELQERMTQLAALRQVDVEINSSLQFEAVLQLALHAAYLLSEADAGFIALYENGVMQLRQAIGTYVTALNLDTVQILPIKGVVKRAVEQRTPEIINDVNNDPDYVHDLPDTRAQMVFPLISSDRLTGVLNLETSTPEKFSQEKFDFLWILTSRIAVAMDNARLYQLSQEQLTELQILYERVKRLEGLKTDMIRIASHDLRNPVGVIKGYLEILTGDLEDRTTTDEKDYLDTIKRSVNRINNIINDILSLERIEESARADHSEIVDLHQMLTHSIRESEANAIRKQQKLTHELTDQQVLIQAHPAQLQEAIVNLIDNAIKYTPEKGKVEIRLLRNGNTARIEVEDNGYGIPVEMQTRLFEPFYRAKSPETLMIDGTGLGLHLVKNIIERHGGQMVVQSTYGEGSLFGFEIPIIPGT